MNCQDISQCIQDLADSELNDQLASEVRAHLSECPGCARKHEEIVRLKQLVRSKTRVAPPAPEFTLQLLNGLAQAGKPAPAGFSGRRALAAAAAAAILLAAGSLGYWLFLKPSPPPIVYADALKEFAQRFNLPAQQVRACNTDQAVLKAIREQAGVVLETIPHFQGARLDRWSAETIHGQRSVRLDYYEESKQPRERIKPVLSVFAIPFKSLDIPDALSQHLESSQMCNCFPLDGVTLLCFRDQSNCLNLVTRVELKKLATCFLRGWKCEAFSE